VPSVEASRIGQRVLVEPVLREPTAENSCSYRVSSASMDSALLTTASVASLEAEVRN